MEPLISIHCKEEKPGDDNTASQGAVEVIEQSRNEGPGDHEWFENMGKCYINDINPFVPQFQMVRNSSVASTKPRSKKDEHLLA